jgi:hypothetical protein
MKMKIFLIVVAVLAISSVEWMMRKVSGLVVSKIKESEEN